MNNLVKLFDFGQSYWLDNLTREKIKSGELKKRVSEFGLRGITSNPSIFNKAISKSHDYDNQIKQLSGRKKTVKDIYEALTVKDVQDACDILRPVFDESMGADGFVSLEVSPYLAHDTQGTIEEARRLIKEVNKPNCFIKIPGTTEGVPAIEQMLYEGVNINITLLFSIESYEAVARAYFRAIERRNEEGKSINNLASVASFFLSRIDVLVDELLGHLIIPGETSGRNIRPELLLGKSGIASAKIAYQSFKKIFSGERWEKLKSNGARVQRPLWASTSTKDPLYSDVKYVETLIGSNTVNTLPDITINAFYDHGNPEENTIEKNLDEAYQVFADLENIGIDMKFVTLQLINEGVQKFIESYNELMETIANRRTEFLGEKMERQVINFGALSSEVNAALKSLDEKQYSRRLYSKDAYLWKSDQKTVEAICNRLGWLDVEDFINKAPEIIKFAKQVKFEKFKYVVLLGMGGSSLCPEVSSEIFKSAKGFPELIVLDNTSPEAVSGIEKRIDLGKTIFIVASKSGTTTETLSFYKYFYSRYINAGIDSPGKHFVAITDPDTSLEQEARSKDFKYIFSNPAGYGGRYSALSYFGLVPMALIGADINKILDNAHQMKVSNGEFIPSQSSPGISLGTFLGINAGNGKDKITFILSESVKAFGYWVEQLIAESTGKEGKGLIPIESEPLGIPGNYSNDRIFVYLHLSGDVNQNDEKKLIALEKMGHPVVRIELKNKYAVGAEYFRWEMATATSGLTIGVNPFDEPNVAESKKNSKDLLNEFKEKGSFTEGEPVISQKGISVFMDPGNERLYGLNKNSLKGLINSFVKLAVPPDYISLLAYFMKTPRRNKILQDIRLILRNKLKTASTVGYGPRYLHSTGQLHKGGPDKGVYIIFSADPKLDLPIPDESYGFKVLQKAQYLGDMRSLNSKYRRVIRVHLGDDIENNLKEFIGLLK